MQSVWRVQPADPQRANTLSQAVGVHPITAQLLLNRGLHEVSQAKRFLNPRLGLFEDPLALPDLARGVSRIKQAIAQREPILIFGDSDVDGLTASVILYEVLRELGAVVRAKQSNRMRDGYGLPESTLQQICRSSIRLVILVDCGTNQSEVVRQLLSDGIDTIIIDHHVPVEDRAKPYALINPYGHDVSAFHELCSAGLAFKVAQALFDDHSDERVASYLDLAALGTLADCSPLIGESRIIVREGLPRIVRSHRAGLQRLCEDTQTASPEPEQIIRRLVPRLNASGRLGDPAVVWRLLRRGGHERLEDWLNQTESAHATTKQLHRQIAVEAQEQVNRLHFRDQFIMVVSRRGWHHGLMGSLASQLVQRYGRPAIALAIDGQYGVGS